jgi:signal peptidase I
VAAEEEEKKAMTTQDQALNKPAADEDEPDDILELAKALALAAIIALTIRSFLFEPFNIPSGSMLPTLLVGDYLFVEKYSYGYSKYSFPLDLGPFNGRIWFTAPQRGDVAVFRQPKHPDIDYIKRIVGLPGDKMQMRGGRLYINNTPVYREYKGRERDNENGVFNNYMKYVETLPGPRSEETGEDQPGVKHWIYEMSDDERYDNTTVYTVPPHHYFAMGDNRDGSLDSRAQNDVGYVPEENLVGRAWFIFFSTAGTGHACDRTGALAQLRTLGCELAEAPRAIRYSRLLKRVNAF